MVLARTGMWERKVEWGKVREQQALLPTWGGWVWSRYGGKVGSSEGAGKM